MKVKVEIPVTETTVGQYDRQNKRQVMKEVTYSKAVNEVVANFNSDAKLKIGDYEMSLKDLQHAIRFLTKDEPVYRETDAQRRDRAEAESNYT